jgi:hypothetical protein
MRLLVKSQSIEGETLAYPDHPLILDGPSLLTTIENVLVASFVYTRRSRPASSAAEYARVVLSRLAYPRNTIFEAVFGEDAMPNATALGFFDSFRVATARSFSQPDGDDTDHAEVLSAVEQLRSPHFARFAANQQGKLTENPGGRQPSFSRFPPMATPQYKFVERDRESIVARIPDDTRVRTTDRIQRVAETFAASDYGLGLGTKAFSDVAGALDKNDYHLEQHPLRAQLNFSVGRTGIDVSKPLRAAHFAGGLVNRTW